MPLLGLPVCFTNRNCFLSGDVYSFVTIVSNSSTQVHSRTLVPSGSITYNCGYGLSRSLENTILPRSNSGVRGAGVAVAPSPVAGACVGGGVGVSVGAE